MNPPSPPPQRGQYGLERHTLAPHPLDALLADPAEVGRAASLARAYLATPRCLLWWHPSRDWRVVVLLPPIASRMALLRNPIFGQLVRDWGTHLRAFGIDRDRQLRDLGPVLSDGALSRLMLALSRGPEVGHDEVLDVLLDALDNCSTGLGTMDVPKGQVIGFSQGSSLDPSRDPATAHPAYGGDYGAYDGGSYGDPALGTSADRDPYLPPAPLMRQGQLEPGQPGSLFDRAWRYPELLQALRDGLHAGDAPRLDQQLYVRLLAAIETRESMWEHAVAARLQGELDASVCAALQATRLRLHVGAYNWLLADAQHRPHRLNFLTRLPAFAPWAAETLLPLHDDVALNPAGDDAWPDDLRLRASLPQRRELDPLLQRAIDGGQDRMIVATLAARFGITDNTIRQLWRDSPPHLEGLPSWQLPAVLHKLDATPARHWPRSANAWERWIVQCVPPVVEQP